MKYVNYLFEILENAYTCVTGVAPPVGCTYLNREKEREIRKKRVREREQV